MHTGLFRLSIFTSSRDMAKKQKNIFKFNNIALCGIQNRCIWVYSGFYFHLKPRYAKKTIKIFLKFYNHCAAIKDPYRPISGFLFSPAAEIWPKNKKIFLKFNNIALCGIQNRCIWAYSELFIFIRSRDMAKKQKKIFLKFYNVAFRDMAKKQKKLILKFYNVALCGIQNR
ncbi:hypothetical protein PUN28_009743 [Cardiocondyla obscurior]|uniref:Uncharacterized protein n=1 Tax=Cardiocondyla obscurior TaxID=286306 RepID=A0AAW2FK80_9HYME